MLEATFSFKALWWYTKNLTTSMLLTFNKVFGMSAFCCLYINWSCLSEIFIEECTFIRFNFLCTRYWTALGMLEQVFNYGKWSVIMRSLMMVFLCVTAAHLVIKCSGKFNEKSIVILSNHLLGPKISPIRYSNTFFSLDQSISMSNLTLYWNKPVNLGR